MVVEKDLPAGVKAAGKARSWEKTRTLDEQPGESCGRKQPTDHHPQKFSVA